jgi:hypothetical protein
VLDPDDRPVAKGKLCAQAQGFNLHAATKVATNDKQGRLTLCKYILRPRFAARQRSPQDPRRRKRQARVQEAVVGRYCLIALIKTEAVARKILKAMHLPSDIPQLHPARLHPARPPRPPPGDTGGGEDWLN